MTKLTGTYRTVSKPSEEILFKEKKSKFFAQAIPISNEIEVKPIIESLKKKHYNAGHVCYAWQLGPENIRYRTNDDGEPNNSAGLPIYGQIQAYEITNVLITVTRVFGGTKLGVGGLISAYRTAAQMALEAAVIKAKIITLKFKLVFGYEDMDKVMRIIKQQQFKILKQELELRCQLVISVRKSEAETINKYFESLHKVKINAIEN